VSDFAPGKVETAEERAPKARRREPEGGLKLVEAEKGVDAASVAVVGETDADSAERGFGNSLEAGSLDLSKAGVTEDNVGLNRAPPDSWDASREMRDRVVLAEWVETSRFEAGRTIDGAGGGMAKTEGLLASSLALI
jgi:hypothetical protein